jgi:superfamily II DNA/RNA helicase
MSINDLEFETWDDLEINANLLRGIYNYGYDTPSPIQKKGILPIIKGRDILAQAQSGTGKTATFTIGALQLVDLSISDPQVIVLSPTRELSIQTTSVIEGLSKMMEGIKIKSFYSNKKDKEEFNRFSSRIKEHIVCGCTGKISDILKRGHLNPASIKLIILDEADEMLSEGFREEVYFILNKLNKDIQIALFSATLPPHILNIVNSFMRDPIKIEVKSEMLTLEGISQYFAAVENDMQKYDTLKDLFSFISLSQCIIYCNSVKRVEELTNAMLNDDFPVNCLHSNMSKQEREKNYDQFRNGKSRVLISSNVTARGIDIQQVSTVINFDVPRDIHTYLHRIGRSGRWGRKGTAINLITRRDIEKIKEIESYYACQINPLPENMD